MIDSCTVDIEYCDRRTNRVLSRKKREDAAVHVRKINGGVEIKITALNIVDLFITEKPVLFDRQKTEGILKIKMLEQLCVVHISNASESQIVNCLQAFSFSSPGAPTRKTLPVSNLWNEDDNKENKASHSDIRNRAPTVKASSRNDLNVDENALVKSTPEKNVLGLTCDQRKAHLPVKRQIAFGTGTPSKPSDVMRSMLSPQNLRKQGRFVSVSPKASPKNGFHNYGSVEIRKEEVVSHTQEQKDIISACLAGKNVFFTGGAGTGKSTLLLLIVEKLIAKHGRCNVFVTATTGLAACAVGGTTIHQFAGISVSGNTDLQSGNDKIEQTSAVKCALRKQYVVRQIRQAHVLIIDEVSMMGPDLLETLNAIAQGCRLNQRPMGGLQVIFTGDFFQLPPISNTKGNSKNNLNFSFSQKEISRSAKLVPSPKKLLKQKSASTDKISNFFQPSNKSKSKLAVISSQTSEINAADDKYMSMSQQVRESDTSILRFCFQSPAWNEIIGGNTFKLSTVFRQSETVFASLLNSIRYGELTDATKEALHLCVGREFDSADGILPTRIFTHRKDVDDLNDKELQALPGDVVEFKSADSGDPYYLRSLQSFCPAKAVLKLKVGAQVILTKSIDPPKGLVNGCKAVVVRFSRDTRRPIIRFLNGIERTIMNENFAINLAGRTVAQRIQIPLDLAWGISVHKSQGMTVDRAIVSLQNVFEYGQAYVALSRVRTLEGLSLETPLTKDQVKSHPKVVDYYNRL